MAELKGRIEMARKGTSSLADEALQYRREYQSAHSEYDRMDVMESIDHRADQIRGNPISEVRDPRTGDYQYAEADRQKANQFFGIAIGQLTPLSAFLEGWIAEAHVQARTAGDHRRAVKRLTDWGVETVEAVDRKKAGAFVTWMLSAKTQAWTGDRKTVTKYISSLSSYWRWLVQKRHAQDNPWIGQAPPKAKAHLSPQETQERPFTDAEVADLLNGPADETIADLMRIAALSGMRIEEICRLRVKDCSAGVFDINRTKTRAGVRKVPIHPRLGEIIDKRLSNKSHDEYLFHELPEVPVGSQRERSMLISKRFGRYRERIGVDEHVEGKRRSRINFHSFRRWFVTKAEQAGQQPHIIESVVGHKRQGMTLGRYSGGSSLEQMRACVDAVKLPTE